MSNLIVLNEKNEDVYDRLIVSLEAGLGTLQILLAVCDNTAIKQEVIRRYEAELEAEGVRVYRLALNLEEPCLLQALIDGKIIEKPHFNIYKKVMELILLFFSKTMMIVNYHQLLFLSNSHQVLDLMKEIVKRHNEVFEYFY